MSRIFPFDGEEVVRAIRATFARRGTALPGGLPVALTDAFAADATKRAQCAGFVRRSGASTELPDLAEVVRGGATLPRGAGFRHPRPRGAVSARMDPAWPVATTLTSAAEREASISFVGAGNGILNHRRPPWQGTPRRLIDARMSILSNLGTPAVDMDRHHAQQGLRVRAVRRARRAAPGSEGFRRDRGMGATARAARARRHPGGPLRLRRRSVRASQ